MTPTIEQMIFPSPPRWNPPDAFSKARQEVSGDGWVGYVMQEANDPEWLRSPPPLLGPWPEQHCDHCPEPFTSSEAVCVQGCPPRLVVKNADGLTVAPDDWQPKYWHSACYEITHPWRLNNRGRMQQPEKHVTIKAKKIKKVKKVSAV